MHIQKWLGCTPHRAPLDGRPDFLSWCWRELSNSARRGRVYGKFYSLAKVVQLSS